MVAFNEAYKTINVIPVTGADSINGITLAATAAIDNGDGTVTLTTAAAHGLLAGSVVFIEGTTNYDGMRKILSIPNTDELRFESAFVAETPGGTETVKVAVKPKKAFMFLGFRIHLSAVPGASDIISVTLDSAKGAAFDVELASVDLDGLVHKDYIYPNADLPFEEGDILRVAWPNVGNKTFGLEVLVRELA